MRTQPVSPTWAAVTQVLELSLLLPLRLCFSKKLQPRAGAQEPKQVFPSEILIAMLNACHRHRHLSVHMNLGIQILSKP